MSASFVVAALSCIAVYQAQRDTKPIISHEGRQAAIVIPIRGTPPTLPALWQALSRQTYRPFRVIFAVESTDDPVYAALRKLSGGPPMDIVVAGPTAIRSQKVHNQLAALATLQPADGLVAFADADIVPSADWLVLLVRSLRPHRIYDVVSGTRWLMPADDRWSTAFACVAGSSVSTLRRPANLNLAWGGSLIMHREAFEALHLDKCWERAALDDLPLTRAVWALGGQIVGRRDTQVASPVAYGWKDAIAFGRRQYLFVRMHAPLQWAIAAIATTLPLIGWAAAVPLAAIGDRIALGAIAATFILDHTRGRLRARIPRKLWGKEMSARVAWLDRWATPAWLAFHAAIIWSTLFGRRITWAGRTYVIDRERRIARIIVSDDDVGNRAGS